MAAAAAVHVLLVGLPGSGKSTVAPELARGLGTAWVDLDDAVAERAGRSVRELFGECGEERFRELEVEELAAVLAGAPVVTAAGGGLLGSPAARVLAGGCFVVWLRAGTATLSERLAPAAQRSARPLLDTGAGDGAEGLQHALEDLAGRRNGTYADAADLVVDVDHRDPTEVAGIVLTELSRRGDT